jgi:hypothetical protein
MFDRAWSFTAVLALVLAVAACSRPALAPSARTVTVSILPPAASCVRIADVQGRAGGQLEGSPFGASDNALVSYAMNDLRNEAASHGADYVHRSEPTFSTNHGGRVTHAAYAGVAYRCGHGSRV